MSPDGKHGKVVSIYEAGSMPWSNITSTDIGNTAQSDINGAGNTVAIIMQSGHTSSAARLCADMAYGGYDDWYLPSRDELNQVYTNKNAIDATATANGGEVYASTLYWSSTENLGSAWTQNFSSGVQGDQIKNTDNRVRAVRAF